MMATLTLTLPANSNAGGVLRKLGKQLETLAAGMPDNVSGGGSVVLTIDTAPSTGSVSVQITGGPYTSAAKGA